MDKGHDDWNPDYAGNYFASIATILADEVTLAAMLGTCQNW